MLKGLFFVTLLLLQLPYYAISQLRVQKNVDSLQKLLQTASDEKKKIEILNQLSLMHFTINADKGIDFAKQALILGKKINWKAGIARSYNCMASNYWAKYDYGNAMTYYAVALKISESINDRQCMVSCWHNIGTCYQSQGINNQAIIYYRKCLAQYYQMGNLERVYGCLSNIAEVYADESKYNDALNFFQQALQVSRKIKDERHIDFFSERIAMTYLVMGNIPKALQYENVATVSLKKLNYHEDTMRNLEDLGQIYMQAKNYPQAIFEFKSALKILPEFVGNNAGSLKALFYGKIGSSYLAMATNGRQKVAGSKKTEYLKLAIQNLSRSVKIAGAADSRSVLADNLEALSTAWTVAGDYRRALDNYKQFVTNRDSLSGSEKQKEYTRRGIEFEFERKRDSISYISKLQKVQLQQANVLNSNRLNQRLLIAATVIITLLFVVFYVGFTKRIQRIKFTTQLAKEKSETELNQMMFAQKLNDLTLASLASQMNPHFIFNCLNSIKYYVEINEPDAASLYISRFAKLIRYILDGTRQETVTLSKELELLQLYLEMEKLRLKEKLQYEFKIADNIEADFIEIPSLLIQPYVENSIWHGIMPKRDGGKVTLSFEKSADQKYLVVKIEDNGIGRKKAAGKGKPNGHVSHSGNLNNDRIAMLNAKYNVKTEVLLTDLEDADYKGSGTLTTLKLFFNEIFESSNY